MAHLLKLPNQFGALVKNHRTKRGWTQTELARHVGTTQQWISGFEGGKPSVEFGMVLRTLAVLRIGLRPEMLDETRSATGGISNSDLVDITVINTIIDGGTF